MMSYDGNKCLSVARRALVFATLARGVERRIWSRFVV